MHYNTLNNFVWITKRPLNELTFAQYARYHDGMDKQRDANLYSLILAAGEARRFGSPKQLAMLAGKSLLQRADSLARSVTERRRLVVAGAHLAQVLPALTSIGTAFVINRDWREGPGSSIGAGIRALPSDCTGVLVWHADQVLLRSRDLSALRDVWQTRQTHIVAASFDNNVGAPVIFPRRVFSALQALDARNGAKHIITSDELVVSSAMQRAAFDVDTQQDLAHAEQHLATRRAHD